MNAALRFYLVIRILVPFLKVFHFQTTTDLITPRCEGNTISYSIIADIRTYLENVKNIDGREIYSTVDDLKTKKIGLLEGAPYNSSNSNVTVYYNYDQILEDLWNHNLDGICLTKGVSNFTLTFSQDLYSLNEAAGKANLGFAFQKNKTKLLNQMNNFLRSWSNVTSGDTWLGFDEMQKQINKNLAGTNGILNIMARCQNPPFSYIEDGELIGYEIQFIYRFAKIFGYQFNMTTTEKIEDILEGLKNKTIDIGIGSLPITDEYNDSISYSNVFQEDFGDMLIRFENSKKSEDWIKIYDSIDDFDGRTLGSLDDATYINITKNKFPNSTLKIEKGFYDLYKQLLYKNIDGFVIEKPIVDYFYNNIPEIVAYYNETFGENKYGFGFQKNENGSIILEEFNDFLASTNLSEIYEKWTTTNVGELHINNTLNTSSEKTITAAFVMDLIPLGFMTKNASKGYELEILYKFAREKNYNLNLISLEADSERISYLLEGKADITGGHFTITDERKNFIHFSEPIIESNNVFFCRSDSKRENLKTIIVDEKYEEKTNNNVDIEVKFSNISKTSSCIFPKEFNDTIIINCTISNVTEQNPYYEGFEYGNTSDKINFIYYNFDANNFFNANSIMPQYNIIRESNKSQIICKYENNGTSKNGKSTVSSDSSNSSESSNNYFSYYKNKHSSGLSTGGIIAIIIPLSLVLIAVIVLALVKMPKKNEPININDSFSRLNIQHSVK